MSGVPRDIHDSNEQGIEGPDFFSYYTNEVARLLSESEDILNVPTSSIPEFLDRKCSEVNGKGRIDYNCHGDGPFSGSIGASVSDLKKERLKAVLMQSVNDLSKEVDEVLDPVLSMHRLKCQIWGKNSSRDSGATSNVHSQMSPSSLLTGISANFSKEEENDLQFLIQSDSKVVEESLKKYSDELSNTLEHMENKLEDLLDTVTEKCRPMTTTEKRQLQKMIQKLPPENLVRVAEIIQHKKPEGIKHQEGFFVNLELEENATLWRLYYYVQVFENSKKQAK